MHGHIEELIDAGVERIFYPCLSYNIDEHASDNHYNCPVVAYYSEAAWQATWRRLQRGSASVYPYLNHVDERKGALLYAVRALLLQTVWTYPAMSSKRAVGRGLCGL